MSISWYPGHMAKTRRLIEENIRQVDAVVELCDARIPYSSRNPILPELLGNKPCLLILNKSDMADPAVNSAWVRRFQAQGTLALLCDSISGAGLSEIAPRVRDLLQEKIRRDEQKGMTRAIKIMVVGVPNVGKSSFINKLSGRKAAKVENRPGVTRDKQWVRLSGSLDLLDMPGILWPKFEDEEVGYRLAATGAIKDTILDTEDVASRLLQLLRPHYEKELTERYKITLTEDMTGFTVLEAIGAARGFKISGGEIDTERAAKMVLEELRSVKIGRISLERP